MKFSFKFKIAALSFLVSGTLLAAFGVTLFAFIYSSSIDQMDSELQALIEGPLSGPMDRAFWERFGTSFEFIMEETSSDRVELLVLGADNEILYKTTNAPPQLAELPLPELPPPPEVSPGPQNMDFRPMGTNVYESSNSFIPYTGIPTYRGPYYGSPYYTPPFYGNGMNPFAPPEESSGGFPLGQTPPYNFGPGQTLPNNLGLGQTPFYNFGPENGFDRPDPNGPGRIDHQDPRQSRRGGGRDPGFDMRRDRDPLPTASKFQTLKLPAGNWRTGILRNQNATIFAAMDMNSFNEKINRFRNAFLIFGSLGLALLGVAGWFLAGRAMKPIAVIAQTTEGITAKGLNQRIPQVGKDVELVHLVTVANNMLDRLEKSYLQAIRFSADAAHELQTPLAILQGELDNALQSAEIGSDEQQRCGTLLEELRNLKSVVQKLLILSHADEGRLKLNLEPVDLGELIHDAAEDLEIMAPELTTTINAPEKLIIQADRALVNQIIRNMTSNAAKYTTPKGTVAFNLTTEGKTVQFTLSNSATPIPEEDRPLLFDRFHRVEKSRTTAGSGLGLSLAREIARAHGGDLVLDPAMEETVSFTLTLLSTEN
ncbi:MAG: hypothetical protein JXR23_09190 [Pontiellaceae bacterium]|nr:hypothetical protein [Pontiellaceae bacterium]